MTSEQAEGPKIVGSAEPLTPEETRKRLEELEAWGVDLSLVRASLAETPTERIMNMISMLEFSEALQQAYANQVLHANPLEESQEH